ncbi:MAG: cell surface protein [Alistipes sp.]|nr:cell surface protein [Alistipes sp.]
MEKILFVLLAVMALYGCNSSEVISGEDEEPPGYEFDKVKVVEYTPAPGQFINETYVPADATDAVRWAQERIDAGYYVSLGAFGGYIILQPSEAITNRDGYDFGISGNPIPTHNEPGIVWVSRDDNGNGVPDDNWYELKGSNAVTRSYSVTYYRTDTPEDVRWTDSNGESGTVKYVPAYHSQNYYPMWCDDDGSFTLTGSLIAPNPSETNSQLSHDPYGWGYADNLGADMFTDGYDRYVFNRFDLDNAVDADGSPVKLDRVDFIKVQSAVLYNLEVLGEISTEVTSLVLLK